MSALCLYCFDLIAGVEDVEDYPDVVVLYAHKPCHARGKAMDPKAIWSMLRETLQDLGNHPDNTDTRAHAVDLLEVLARWLRMGGFPPQLD